MSKIVTAVNKMIENIDKVSKIMESQDPSSSEIFFLYDNKFKWSIIKSQGTFSLFYYPDKNIVIEYLASLPSPEFDNIKMVSYRTDELKTTEALESFSELYKLLQDKVTGVDDVLDEIINS